MKEKVYCIYRTAEFRSWYVKQTERAQVQIDSRLSHIQDEGHFGDHKFVGSKDSAIWELKWKSGRRIYFAYIPKNNVLLLLGGNKNGQSKDIKKAKSLLKKNTE